MSNQVARASTILAALFVANAAYGANCVYTSIRVLVDPVPAGGAIPLHMNCALPCGDEPPNLRVFPDPETNFDAGPADHDGGADDGSANNDGGPNDDQLEVGNAGPHSRILSFRPNVPLTPGHYQLVVGSAPDGGGFGQRPIEFDVVEGAAPSVDDFEPTFVGTDTWVPDGDRACCPVTGEGDCNPICVGEEGERRVSLVGPDALAGEAGIAWRVVPTSPADGQATDWMLDTPGYYDDALTLRQALFARASDSYCVDLEAWNLVDGSRETFADCVAGDSEAPIGEKRTWQAEALSTCSAPPVPGGWGLDVGGVPDPNNYLTVPEPLRQAWCASRDDCRSSANQESFACQHYGHYCDSADGGGDASPPPADAGDADGGRTGSADAAPTDGSVATVDDTRQSSEGCGCRTAVRGRPVSGWALGLLGVLMALTRRRMGAVSAT